MLRIAISSFLLFVTALAAAAEESRNLELTPFAGYGMGGDFENADDGSALEFDEGGSLGLILNLKADAMTQWELLYTRQTTELDTASLFLNQSTLSVDVHYLHAGGTYLFEDRGLQPYIAGGLGLSRFDPVGAEFDAESYFSMSLGVGLRFLPSQRFGVRLEGRVFSSLVDSDSTIFCRTGSDNNVCAIKVAGSLVTQWHAFAGVTFRF